MNKQPEGRAEGIYFHLSNDDYHRDPALSHSGMTKLLKSWPDYWISGPLNPNRQAIKPTAAMEFGDRSGMLLLDPARFKEQFNTVANYNSKGTGVCLSSIEYGKIMESVNGVLEVKEAREHFTDGYPEVSVFWRDLDTGIMLRAKIDYLRTFGIIDAKRIKEVDNWEIGRAVKNQGLDIQAFVYLEALKAARRILKAMKPKELENFAAREKVSFQWLQAFMDDEDLLFRFLFQRSTPPYIWEFRELEPEVLQEGAMASYKAMQLYTQGIGKYGIGKPPMGSPVVKTISPHHVPRRDYDYND